MVLTCVSFLLFTQLITGTGIINSTWPELFLYVSKILLLYLLLNGGVSHAGPGAVRIGLIHFQAKCCTRQPNLVSFFNVYFVL